MSLDICRDDPISPRNALIAVAFLAFTVYLRALFSSSCRSVIYFLLRNITSVPSKIDGSAALFQYVFPISSLLQLLAIMNFLYV